MPRKTLLKYLPNPDAIRRNSSLRPIAHLLERTELWHINRRSVSTAIFIGLFCAFIPLPSQMLLAALIAIWLKVNLPLSVALVWVSNPITMGPMFYFAYKLGALLLGEEPTVDDFNWSFGWFMDNTTRIGYPFLLGCLVCSWVSAVSGFVVSRLLWRIHIVRKWQKRQRSN
ncbi:MAG: DUF2062 domain-containing protein [Pseudomonadota bacterium]|nr:DUF2062 domain-containing protein [Pseudomonadota bacterium]MEC8754651.1 DUF2062 domain-containing protein [Pseudomonadota bacterium]MED5347967.1 DUF2062 domain-containing protein [Pseudomonadota bacterium]